jgi:hypothetical protein
MNMNMSIAGLRDLLTELVGIKGEVGLTSSQLTELLRRQLSSTSRETWYYDPSPWLEAAPTVRVRIRPECAESLVARLLFAIGSTGDPAPPLQLVARFCETNADVVATLPPMEGEDEYPFPVTPILRVMSYLESSARSGDTVNVDAFAELAAEYRRRSIPPELMLGVTEWDGVLPLTQLFDGERPSGFIVGNPSTEPLIDQRFSAT